MQAHESSSNQGHAHDRYRGGIYSHTYVTTPDSEINIVKGGEDVLYRHVNERSMQMHLEGTITLVLTESELLNYMKYHYDNNRRCCNQMDLETNKNEVMIHINLAETIDSMR